MKQRTSQIVYAYWNDVRGTRAAPRRFEIEPARISAILSETFILEHAGRETYTFRLAGTKLCEQLGGEFRGRNFLEGWTVGERDVYLRHFTSMSRQASISVFTIRGTNASGDGADFEIVVLPLVHTNDRVDRFLGTISAIDPPAWLGSTPLLTRTLVSDDLVWPDGRPHALLERNHRQAPFIPQPPGSRIVRAERRQFRVYDGGRTDTADDS